ncbi:bifunctional metallophosphatase/5'-nucleotidase [Novosphingobium sp.]|uniref:bifunctional metallophosphatase/5'-nucleotidase n=1 Tax=Novosphingobium sp. TaxID=1874826 RepID=UPI0025FA74C7|nr:bifunctional metallophosphatase/5'-nucleotidase [Novosphingobium sp.]
MAINDFHGALEPPKASVSAPGSNGATIAVPAGGAACLASALRQIRAAHRYHLTVSAGDLTSASQFASSIYLDEPSVGVANRIGIDFNAVGNHEFDRGWHELQRLQHGGCAKLTSAEPCRIERFPGAKFTYLAANVFGPDGQTIFPATALRSFGRGRRKVAVGVIGLTLRGTSDLVSPDRVAGLRFTDEAEAINAGVTSLKAQGAQAVVVLIHQGIRTGPSSGGVQDPSGCDKPAGDLQPVLAKLDRRVDLVVSGHTHWAYVCEFARANEGGAGGPLMFTSAGLYGKLVTDVTLAIDPDAGRVVSRKAHNVIVQSEAYTGSNGPVALTEAYPRFAPAPDVAGYVAQYVAGAKATSAQVIGHLSGPATKGPNAESAQGGVLGHLIADSQLAASRGAGAEIALMNPFGIRAPLVPKAATPNAGAVTFGDVFQVQPFSNRLTTLSLSGAELKSVLEQGLDDSGPKQWLSPSEGFGFRYDMARAAGDRITAITLNGQPIDPARRYRVTVNSFLALGGDGFSLFTKGTDAVLGMTDVEALEAWIKAVPLRSVPAEMREQPTG